ncbi:DUF6236 family protein [Acinetobacter johnsonii]|uniref:DUF6236 family protein n=1 Tax=Acinetobacter johnsonii TaxID=40214 RepID=UPI003D186963
MGEAKRRGSFDERKKLATSRLVRGIITPPGDVTIIGNSYSFSGGLSEELMYYFGLYWDKIAIPSGIVGMQLACDEEFIRNDVLEKISTYQIPPHASYIKDDGKSYDLASHELWAFGEIAKQKLLKKGEAWSINHINGDPIYMPQHRLEQDSIRLRIADALPYPALTGEYNIVDLLEFKRKRSDELGQLHESMDNLLSKIIKEPIQDIRENEIKRFENAVLELDKTLMERFKFTNKSNWELNVSSPDMTTLFNAALGVSGGIMTDNGLGNNFPYMTTLSLIGSTLSLSKNYGFTFNQYAKDDLKLEYITRAKSENILL